MRTNNKPLTLEQQEKLYNDMINKHMSQVRIARINNLKNSKSIHQVCTGQYNITPLMKKYFMNAGINLDEIMDDNVIIKKKEKLPVCRYTKPKYRRLTKRETEVLYFKLYKHFKRRFSYTELFEPTGILPAIISKLFKSQYPVSPMVIDGFKKINIDLEDL